MTPLAAIDAATVTAIFTGLAVLIAAVSSAFMSWKAATKSEAVSKKADEIKVQVDGNLTRATSALAVANEANLGYQRLIAEMTLAKEATQELAIKQAEHAPAPPPVLPPTPPLSP